MTGPVPESAAGKSAAEAALSPHTLAEAVRLLGESPDLLPVAGGTDLMVADRLWRARHGSVLDLTRVAELRGVRRVDGGIEIGAATPFAELRSDAQVRKRFPALAAAAGVIGGWQIQNRATLGGNMANASPAGDALPVLSALEAVVLVVGPRGEREIPYRDFHVGYRETALAAGELVVGVRLLEPPEGSRQAFVKVGTREAQAISKVVVAGVGRVVEGRVDLLRLAAGSVAATPLRLPVAEASGLGLPVAGAAERAGEAAAAEVEPIDDVRSTAVYRRAVLGRVVRRLVLGLDSEPGLS
ncbi:MAG: FAD binding domain-containing protein [Thermoanaerobaculia bacterium]